MTQDILIKPEHTAYCKAHDNVCECGKFGPAILKCRKPFSLDRQMELMNQISHTLSADESKMHRMTHTYAQRMEIQATADRIIDELLPFSEEDRVTVLYLVKEIICPDCGRGDRKDPNPPTCPCHPSMDE